MIFIVKILKINEKKIIINNIIDIIKIIKDPEFDNTLEELKVVNENDITFKSILIFLISLSC